MRSEEEHHRPVTYVIGHKNPDTDSICSAIAYADLKSRLCPETDFIPGRAGNINEETAYVLQAFGAEAPVYIDEVSTQIQDIEIRQVDGVPETITLKRAWEIMKERNIVTLPVTEGSKLTALFTVKDIVKVYMDINDAGILAASGTPYENVLEALEAKLLVDSGVKSFSKGRILVAAANPDVLENYIEPGDVVIVPNRYETQLCAIEMQAGCIIVTMGASVSRTIRKLAEERGCAIMTTPHDTYTVARLINQSVPVRYVMKQDGLITFRTDDYLDDVRKAMIRHKHRDFPVLDRSGRYCGIISRRYLLDTRRKRVILVDHNERAQSVDGVEEAEILEIIDHHRIGSVETMSPVFFRNQPVGSTATIVSQMYEEHGLTPSAQIAGLLLAAVISDTLLFRSPTSTEADERAAQQLADLAGIDPTEFSEKMFKAGSDPSRKTAEELFHQDCKTFSVGDRSFGIGQVSSMYAEDLSVIREKLQPCLAQLCENSKMEMVFFLLTDIVSRQSEVLYAGPEAGDFLAEAFGRPVGAAEPFLLPGVISRKKQFVPAILSAIRQ